MESSNFIDFQYDRFKMFCAMREKEEPEISEKPKTTITYKGHVPKDKSKERKTKKYYFIDN